MIDFIKKLFNKPEHEISPSVDESTNIRFILKIKDLDVGYLTIEDDLWTFRYSEAFRSQTTYSRLVGFSDLYKEYQSDVLWPFFKIRIPGLKQPMIREIIESEKINENDEAGLLKRFGRRNTSNPYVLETI